jgi:hypothetical protein
MHFSPSSLCQLMVDSTLCQALQVCSLRERIPSNTINAKGSPQHLFINHFVTSCDEDRLVVHAAEKHS